MAEREGQKSYAMIPSIVERVEIEGQTIKLPADKAKQVKEAGDYNGKTVVLGIRPENILEAKGGESYAFSSTVNVYELLGAEVFLYFDLAGSSITARVEPTTKVRPGDTVKYTFEDSKIHVFDKETELTIAN